MSGPILEDEGIAAAKNDQTRPAWSLAAREESQTTNKETEMDKVNPDNDKCYEENRTSRVTGWPWCGEGGQWSYAASEKTFLRGYFSRAGRVRTPVIQFKFGLYSLATLCPVAVPHFLSS